jgi:hypothetical protein
MQSKNNELANGDATWKLWSKYVVLVLWSKYTLLLDQ